MRTIGVIGGMSWESSLVYYQLINRGIRDRLGPLYSARLLLDSLDFSEIATLQRTGEWPQAGELLAASACRLQAGGADCIVLATNTMHKVADAITAATSLPFLHIADAVGAAIAEAGMNRVLLLGTAFTMEQDFYRKRLESRFNIHCLTPSAERRPQVHRIIYDELCAGIVNETSRTTLQETIAEGVAQGATGVILGCTELMLLIHADNCPVPLFDTTALHATMAVDFALADQRS
ncbi:aspartate/glutamate racemase family protein [Dyella tabacisoli]|uniref:Aspartate/glutamate racemase family protein n=1 Tax=Dyella tabacisoli TaxID=2282381 RepID=A0A369ULC7_9GAMM|nr:aspartate/glutamate racemase family protein [Dyella tabacisoli]RDD81564.1 aspartate/glutamate racemase family protein [Dyella tabacisoli]